MAKWMARLPQQLGRLAPTHARSSSGYERASPGMRWVSVRPSSSTFVQLSGLIGHRFSTVV